MLLLNKICLLISQCYDLEKMTNECVKVCWPQRWFWSSVCTARVHISPPAGSWSTHPSECPSLLTPGNVVRGLRKHLLWFTDIKLIKCTWLWGKIRRTRCLANDLWLHSPSQFQTFQCISVILFLFCSNFQTL